MFRYQRNIRCNHACIFIYKKYANKSLKRKFRQAIRLHSTPLLVKIYNSCVPGKSQLLLDFLTAESLSWLITNYSLWKRKFLTFSELVSLLKKLWSAHSKGPIAVQKYPWEIMTAGKINHSWFMLSADVGGLYFISQWVSIFRGRSLDQNLAIACTSSSGTGKPFKLNLFEPT